MFKRVLGHEYVEFARLSTTDSNKRTDIPKIFEDFLDCIRYYILSQSPDSLYDRSSYCWECGQPLPIDVSRAVGRQDKNDRPCIDPAWLTEEIVDFQSPRAVCFYPQNSEFISPSTPARGGEQDVETTLAKFIYQNGRDAVLSPAIGYSTGRQEAICISRMESLNGPAGMSTNLMEAESTESLQQSSLDQKAQSPRSNQRWPVGEDVNAISHEETRTPGSDDSGLGREHVLTPRIYARECGNVLRLEPATSVADVGEPGPTQDVSMTAPDCIANLSRQLIQNAQPAKRARPQQQEAFKQSARRRKISSKNRVSFPDVDSEFQEFVSKEKPKCSGLAVSSGRPDHDVPTIDGIISRHEMRPYERLFKSLYYGTASCESFVCLQGLLRHYQKHRIGDMRPQMRDLSTGERLKVIYKLSTDMALTTLLRLCHIQELSENISRTSSNRNDGFFNSTPESMSLRRHGRFGNPNNCAEADITSSILHQFSPELQPGTAGYLQEYKRISRLRRLGKRLHLLTNTFGYGILALSPLVMNPSIVEYHFSVSETM